MIFLKLGGSLITDKSVPETAQHDTIRRISGEIREAVRAQSGIRLLIGHGSGSFGHSVAARYGTHRGATTAEDWRGFAEVWSVAGRLARLVVDGLREAGLPAMGFPPSASCVCNQGEIEDLAVEPLRRALDAGLLPVVGGDVAVDRSWGTTIVSTERVFAFLAPALHPARVLLAGIEAGVYTHYPEDRSVVPVLREADRGAVRPGAAAATDVTGGMAEKVEVAFRLARTLPGLEVRIFSGVEPGSITRALLGETPGTLILP